MSKDKTKLPKKTRNPLFTSVLLFLMAIAAVTATTIAWLSIADNTKVKSMDLDVTSGTALRFDLDPHATFNQYVSRLNFRQISERMNSDLGFDMTSVPLEPVTTADFSTFTYEDGTEVEAEKGAYLTFTLHFMAMRDMVVHLSSATSSQTQGDNTVVSSSNAQLPAAIRIAFTVDGATYIYNPGMGATSEDYNGGKMFGLSDSGMVYTDDNALFPIKQEVNKEVLVHIWLEGTDPACTDELRGVDYSIALRFEGTDNSNQLLEGERQNSK